MFGHFLQSHDWEAYEKIEGHKTFWLEGEGYHALAVEKTTPVGKYLFCPYGPAVKEVSKFAAALDSLHELAVAQGAIFVRVEPTFPVIGTDGVVDNRSGATLDTDDFKKMGLVKSHDIDPAHTWVVDLTGTPDDVLNGTEKDRVRHWKSHDKRGVRIWTTKNPDDIEILTKLLEELGEARKFTPQDTEHLRNQLKAGFATLYVAEYDEGAAKAGTGVSASAGAGFSDEVGAGDGGKVIAATLVHDYDGTRFVMHAAADDKYRKVRAGTSLALQAMIDAQAAGFSKFDFWGITTSDNPKHPWYGFTQYKKSFDGVQVDYAGTWDLPVNKVKYKVYQMLRAANKVKRKVAK